MTGVAAPLGPGNILGELKWDLSGLTKAIDAYAARFHVELGKVVEASAFRLEARFKQHPGGTPRDTGRAANSWHTVVWGGSPACAYKDDRGKSYDGTTSETPVRDTQALVASNVIYMMCLSTKTKVVTERGKRWISLVRVGDRVLTQDGTYRRVLGVSSFPAVDKPDLVRLKIEWRRGKRATELELTEDHQILARVDGVLKWVQAGHLTTRDQLWRLRKISQRKGRLDRPKHPCYRCGKLCHWRRKFCGNECQLAWRRGPENPHIGLKRSPETIAKMRAHGQKVNINRLASISKPTTTENAVEAWIASAGLRCVKRLPIKEARAIVDFAIPELRLFIEADGSYWHRDQTKDVERDKRILAARPGWQIIHFHFADSKYSPASLNPEPVEGSHYLVCNPGMKSYCDASRFRPARILSIEKFRYEVPPRNDRRGTRIKRLWDLSVEDVHSFVANGVIVSNSLEAGHSKQAPSGFIRRHVAEERQVFLDAVTAAKASAGKP